MVAVHVGYAAGHQGRGVAYARLITASGERLVRAAFHVRRLPGLDEREVGYAALTAIVAMLVKRGIDRVALYIADDVLVEDHNARRRVPPPLVLPYVRLGCALNRLRENRLLAGADADLTARAAAEVALHHVA